MELYIHIPFCKSKCQYCDFVSFKVGCDKIDEYIDSLLKEISLSSIKFKDRNIDTIYIGGGTPSILSIEQISRIINKVNNSFNIINLKEFTIECNPESITEDKLVAYKSLGINRISIGVQSLLDINLTEIGRVHNTEQAINAINIANKYFDNVSADLIIGLPYDTIESVQDEVDIISKIVKHISMYELILEEGTILKNRVDNNLINLPNDDMVQDLFDVAIKTAYNNGFIRYEISNFSKPNYHSIHNYGYWIREEYLGLGLNSSSLIKENNEVRFLHLSNLDSYCENINRAKTFDDIFRVDEHILNDDEIKKEEIMLNLRTKQGIDKSKLIIPENLNRYFVENNGLISLTDEGMAVMNSLLVELM